LGVKPLDSGFRRKDRTSRLFVIPAKAGIQKYRGENSLPTLLSRYFRFDMNELTGR